MEGLFYYADENSQPVGPLSFDEIRKFTSVGVVPADVMVCEAGGEDWRSLDSIAKQHQVEPAAPSEELSPSDQAKTASRLKLIYIGALISALVSFALGASSTRAAVENAGTDPNELREMFSAVVSLVALAGSLALLYNLVQAFPKHLRFTTPVKAAGFYLIPIFSIYWVFHLFHGLVTATRKWGDEVDPALSKRISWLHPFAFVAAGLIALDEILVYLEIFGAFDHSVVRIARTNHAIAYIGYAAASAAFFHFTLCIVQILRGLLDPEDYEEESKRAKDRGFFSIGPVKWGPSYGYYLFFIIAGMAWR